jgi:hypothetical protein
MRRGLTYHVDAMTRNAIVINFAAIACRARQARASTVVIRFIAAGSVIVVGAMAGAALRPKAHLTAAFILSDLLRALDALPLEADSLVQVWALRSVGEVRIQRYAVVAAIERAGIIVEGYVTRILKIGIAPENIAIASLAVSGVVGRELLSGVNRNHACPIDALKRPTTEIQIGSLHPAIVGDRAFRLRRRVTNNRLALDGRSALILLAAIGKPSRAAQPISLRGTDTLPRGTAHGSGKGGAVTLTAACAIGVGLFSAGNRQDENESGESRAQGSQDFPGGHG